MCQVDAGEMGAAGAVPPVMWGCAKWYSLPEGGGKGPERCSYDKRRFYGIQNKHIPFYLYAANY